MPDALRGVDNVLSLANATLIVASPMGAKFEELAQKRSLDEGTRPKGGDLDWNVPTNFDKAFADAMVKLEKGKMTDAPVRSRFGFHVIQLDDVRNIDFPKLDQVRQQLQQRIIGQKVDGLIREDMAEIKKSIGEDADARITAMTQWAKANLDADGYGVLRAAMSQENAADVLKAFEQIVAKTREPAPKPGPDVPPPGANKREEIEAMQGKLGPDGKRLYDTDPKYRAMVEQKWTEFETARMSGGA